MRLTRSPHDLAMALQCVTYDMLMVASAIEQHKNRSKPYPGLVFGKEQIAIETALVKTRSLIDFLQPQATSKKTDILIDDFGLPPKDLGKDIQDYRHSINQWSAHLTWQRALRTAGPKDAPQPYRKQIYQIALSVLKEADAFVRECVERGMKFTDKAEAYYRQFQRLYDQIQHL